MRQIQEIFEAVICRDQMHILLEVFLKHLCSPGKKKDWNFIRMHNGIIDENYTWK